MADGSGYTENEDERRMDDVAVDIEHRLEPVHPLEYLGWIEARVRPALKVSDVKDQESNH